MLPWTRKTWGLASKGELYLWNLTRRHAVRLSQQQERRGEFYPVVVRFFPQAIEWEPVRNHAGGFQVTRLTFDAL